MTPESLKVTLLALSFAAASSFLAFVGYAAFVAPPPPHASCTLKWRASERACRSSRHCAWSGGQCVAAVEPAAGARPPTSGRSGAKSTMGPKPRLKGGAKKARAARLAGRSSRVTPPPAVAAPTRPDSDRVLREFGLGDTLHVAGEWSAGGAATLLEGTCLPSVSFGTRPLGVLTPNCTAAGIDFAYRAFARPATRYPAGRVPLSRFGLGDSTFKLSLQRLKYGYKLRAGRLPNPIMLRGGTGGPGPIIVTVTAAPNSRLAPLRLVRGRANASDAHGI